MTTRPFGLGRIDGRPVWCRRSSPAAFSGLSWSRSRLGLKPLPKTAPSSSMTTVRPMPFHSGAGLTCFESGFAVIETSTTSCDIAFVRSGTHHGHCAGSDGLRQRSPRWRRTIDCIESRGSEVAVGHVRFGCGGEYAVDIGRNIDPKANRARHGRFGGVGVRGRLGP